MSIKTKSLQILALVLCGIGLVLSLLSLFSTSGPARIGVWANAVRIFTGGPVQQAPSSAADPGPGLLVAFFFLLIVITFFELREAMIPDAITIPGMVIAPILALASRRPVLPSLIGLLVGLAVPLVIVWIWSALGKGHGLGMGVVKMLGMVGAFLGPANVIATLVIAIVLSLLYVRVLLRSDEPESIEFGPALVLGAGICAVFPVADWYRAFFS